MIIITNEQTGEIIKLEGRLMVASNGVIFVKKGSETLWASSAPNWVAKSDQDEKKEPN